MLIAQNLILKVNNNFTLLSKSIITIKTRHTDARGVPNPQVNVIQFPGVKNILSNTTIH